MYKQRQALLIQLMLYTIQQKTKDFLHAFDIIKQATYGQTISHYPLQKLFLKLFGGLFFEPVLQCVKYICSLHRQIPASLRLSLYCIGKKWAPYSQKELPFSIFCLSFCLSLLQLIHLSLSPSLIFILSCYRILSTGKDYASHNLGPQEVNRLESTDPGNQCRMA